MCTIVIRSSCKEWPLEVSILLNPQPTLLLETSLRFCLLHEFPQSMYSQKQFLLTSYTKHHVAETKLLEPARLPPNLQLQYETLQTRRNRTNANAISKRCVLRLKALPFITINKDRLNACASILVHSDLSTLCFS